MSLPGTRHITIEEYDRLVALVRTLQENQKPFDGREARVTRVWEVYTASVRTFGVIFSDNTQLIYESPRPA